MKKRITVLSLFLIVVLLLGGIPASASPAFPPGPKEVKLSQRDSGRRVGLATDEILVVELESNPSTGYGWYLKTPNQRVIRQVGAPEWSSASGSAQFGGPGTQTLRFAGAGKGRAQIELVYRRPWEDAAPARSFSVDVNVAGPATVTVGSKEIDGSASEPSTSTTDASLASVPSSFNWCDQGGCTPVRDQGQCGSCWAFGTVGPLESAILLKDGLSKDLSEQYLVSCNTDGWGCDGGWWAHDYHEWKIPPGESAAGAVYENDFPYTASDEVCNGPYTHHETIADWIYVGNDSSVPSTDAIKQAIYDYGPVSAAVCVDNNFQSYTGGVFNPRKPCNSVNHAIVLVGWDDADGAWILRNSWGSNWGENGYMRIAYGKSKVGYSANYVVYSSDSPTPTPTPTSEPTQEPTPTPTPSPTPTPDADNAVHVSAIDMWYEQRGRNYDVYTRVTIVDQNGSAVSGATVDVQLTLPGGSTATGSSTTASDGSVTFSLRSKETGTYVSEVTGVSHSSYTYDATANVETSESLAVP